MELVVCSFCPFSTGVGATSVSEMGQTPNGKESVVQVERRHSLHIFKEESSGENIILVLEWCVGKRERGGEMNKERKIHGSGS